jgi:hypothetical protein
LLAIIHASIYPSTTFHYLILLYVFPRGKNDATSDALPYNIYGYYVIVLWCCGAVVLWCCGAVVLWCCGAVVLCYAKQ